METDEFRRRGKEMIDYVADYLENIRQRQPFPDVQPGYMQDLLPDKAPENGEKWEEVYKDLERVIMPGITHWQHPNFHAYFPSRSSYPSLLADIIAEGLNSVSFTWASSPACTELEVVVLDWLGKMLHLPDQFLACSGGPGGGVIQGTASEATLVALLAARARELPKYKMDNPNVDEAIITSKFIGYCSDQAHTSVEKAGRIAGIKIRPLTSDDHYSLRGPALQEAISEDRERGLIPIYVCATLGTTITCAFDNIQELGIICREEGIWMHIDAAYAGSAFICPEFRPLLDGVENAESFNFNPHKWLNVSFDCSALWVKNSSWITNAFQGHQLHDPYILRGHSVKVPNYLDWHLMFGTRFRALKLWFVLRLYGVKGLQNSIRKDVNLAHQFEEYVRQDGRFEIVGKVTMGLVCFRLKKPNFVNEQLALTVNADRRLHLTPSSFRDVYFLRFAICSGSTTPDDVLYSWSVIKELAEKILADTDLGAS